MTTNIRSYWAVVDLYHSVKNSLESGSADMVEDLLLAVDRASGDPIYFPIFS